MAKVGSLRQQMGSAGRQARASALAAGQSQQQARQAQMQARRTTRQNANAPVPQPPAPAPAPDQGGGGQAGYFEYSPTAESQMNQPYQDMLAAGATGALGNYYGTLPQQQQLGDIYAQGTAQNLGGAQGGMQNLTPLQGQSSGLAGGTMGQYGALMDPNFNIQATLANQIQRIQSGADSGFDPLLDQQLNDQERVMNEQMRRQLGPDWQNSSAGIEAQGKFNQLRQTTLGTSRFNQLQGLLNQQQGGLQNMTNQGLGYGNFGAGLQGQQFGQGMSLGNLYGGNQQGMYNQAMGLRQNQLTGANQLLNQTGAIQDLYGRIPQQMGQFGQAMTGQGTAAFDATRPYQQDRFGQFQASQFPSSGQFAGQMMGQSGNRWVNVGGSMMGGGGGGGGGMDFNQWGGQAGTGQGDPYWQQRWNQAG